MPFQYSNILLSSFSANQTKPKGLKVLNLELLLKAPGVSSVIASYPMSLYRDVRLQQLRGKLEKKRVCIRFEVIKKSSTGQFQTPDHRLKLRQPQICVVQ